MTKKYVKRYSQAFKHQVVKEYEAGASAHALTEKYAIGGSNTVKRWVKAYGRSGYRSETVVIQTVDDQQEVKEMKERIAQLEAALAQASLDNHMLTSLLKVAEKELGFDVKKNDGQK